MRDAMREAMREAMRPCVRRAASTQFTRTATRQAVVRAKRVVVLGLLLLLLLPAALGASDDEATKMLERIVAAHPAQLDAAQLLRNLRDSRGPAAAAPAKAPGRNDPCPCGSGRRFKACHGALG